MSRDDDHLKMLSIAHYCVGALGVLFSLFPLIHVFVGWMVLTNPERMAGDGPPPPPIFGWLFVAMGLALILIGLTCSVCILLSGRRLASRKGYWFSFVIACLECLFIPFGTVLGIFTIVVLSRDSVRSLYGLST